MEVIKVVIKGELPKRCFDCQFLSTIGDVMCIAVMRSLDYTPFRPDWCPLISTPDMASTEDGLGWIVDDPDSIWTEVK